MRNAPVELQKAKDLGVGLWRCDVCDLYYRVSDYLYCPNCGYDDMKVDEANARLKLRKCRYKFDRGGFIIERPENETYYYILPKTK